MTRRRPRRFSVTAMIVVLTAVVACGDESATTETTQGPRFPSVAVDVWLAALSTGEYAKAAMVVEPVGASLVLGVENGLDDETLAEVLESGWSPELTESFWSSFAEEFPLFAGVGLADLVIGRHRDLDVAAGPFAVVEVGSGEDRGRVLTRASGDGTWQVDLLGTLGGAFVPLVFDRVVALGDGPAADLISVAINSTALASLDAAAAAYPEDIRLETEIARIRQVLGSG